ncbi:hypothetical protein ACROYT_G019610 [Oculina patagonica]
MSRLILVPLLVLCIVAGGQCGSPVACSSDNMSVQYKNGKTAKSNNWKYVTSVSYPQDPYDYDARAEKCKDECKEVCVDAKEGGPHFNEWPGCKAFSSYVSTGGNTCWCYGWNSEPSWYDDSGYRSGVCVSQ